MGVENILQRISRYYNVNIPRSERWHIELFTWFCFPPKHRPPLPILFPDALAAEMRPYRQFRHVTRHAYPLELDWSRMEEGIANVRPVFTQFRAQVNAFLETLNE